MTLFGPESSEIEQDTLDYVLRLPIVRSLLDYAASSKLKPLFEANKSAFLSAPAAATHHHNFTHGLVIHTAEVWDAAKAFHDQAPGRLDGHYSHDELFVAAFLHDFAKIVQYEPVSGGWLCHAILKPLVIAYHRK